MSDDVERRNIYYILNYEYYTIKIQELQILFFISDTIDAIFRESHSFVINKILDCFLIFIEYCAPTLEFEEYDLTKRSFRESIEDDVVTSLADEYHILWGVWKIWKCWENFFVDLTEYTTSRSLYCLGSHSLVLMEGDNPHDEYPDDESGKSSENEREYIHTLFFAFFILFHTILLLEKIKKNSNTLPYAQNYFY